MIPIVEIFPTIQGEGPMLGTPSLFVRVGGCDLRCRFKGISCDTPYAVYTPKELDSKAPQLKFGYNKWEMLSVDQLIHSIKTYQLSHVVFTGGHPILYQNELKEVVQFFGTVFTSFEFETQGTIPILSELTRRPNVTFNVSVKLSSSNQEEGYDQKRINVKALQSFPQDRSAYKFVISNPEVDLREIEEILKIRRLPVYLMPEGLTRKDVLKNSPAVVQMCIENGWKFTPRLHIEIWDTKKGV